ncbi:hypothetical protein ACJX0J_022679, partial [Zea mays]
FVSNLPSPLCRTVSDSFAAWRGGADYSAGAVVAERSGHGVLPGPHRGLEAAIPH